MFIDARNLLGGQKEFRKQHPDFTFGYKELIQHFEKDHTVIRGYYYDGAPHKSKQSPDKKRFFAFLRRIGVTLRLKELNLAKPHASQKGVDIYLTTDMISLAYEDAYDIALIASGDGDYEALIEFVKSKGKRVWVLAFKSDISWRLREAADKVFLIDSMSEIFREQREKLK